MSAARAHGFQEAMRRRAAMVEHWKSLGHADTPCIGHTYPLPGCPAPEVHGRVFPPVAVVPKVTADERTHALWALIREDRVKAREIVSSMGVSERRAFLAQLTELVNMLWGEG